MVVVVAAAAAAATVVASLVIELAEDDPSIADNYTNKSRNNDSQHH